MTTRQTSTNKWGTAKWIVDSDSSVSTHTTIAAALTAASSGDTIFIRPGSYTENLTMKAGVNLCAYDCDALTPNVTIVGKLTATFAGTCSISGICLQTNSDFFLVVSGSSATIVNLSNCYLNCTNNTGISYTSSSSSSKINCFYCIGDVTTTGITLHSMSGAGFIDYQNSFIKNTGNSTTASNNSNGEVNMYGCEFYMPFSSSSTGYFDAKVTHFDTSDTNSTAYTNNATHGNNQFISQCFMGVGSAVPIVNNDRVSCRNTNASSSNTVAVSGTGTTSCSMFACGAQLKSITSSFTPQNIITGDIYLDNLVGLFAGSGSPSGSITAPKGSLYLRTDGSSTSTRAYINTNGGTTWTAITTVA